jgi:endoglucanase
MYFCNKTDNAVTPQNSNVKQKVVDYFGFIHVKGSKIVDKNDNPIALHGMSLFWSQWGGSFYNANCLQWLRNDWKCTVIRAACGVESGGYLTNPEAELAKIMTVIDASISLGIYVIVDWHDHNAQNHLKESKEFFRTIAQKYGSKPNIIYEIYNEPLQISWSGIVKPYADSVIKVIRQYDPDNLIVVGTSTWSQDVDVAARTPIVDTNVAYTLHYYSSTHKQWLRDKAIAAINNGAALFVTEYGISEASGNGIIDTAEATKWFLFIDQYKLSTCNWSVIDKNETSAALLTGANPDGYWLESDLSVSGKTIRNRIRRLNGSVFDFLESEHE